ncbi:unnamed protein product [Adineta ricciae]|uniref:Cullin family profile domain-containing protein n=1 Tax=Adineta ricciae TaxID=249248 RepID=A0A815EE72_ADIRI|nr:unnamed protein product [Adineta ricciae]
MYLQRSAEFYPSESIRLLTENDALEYIRKVKALFDDEMDRANLYFDQSIKHRFVQLLVEEFINKHRKHLVEMEKKHIGEMLKTNQYKQLENIYKDFQAVPEGSSIIIDCIGEYIRQTDLENKSFRYFVEDFIDLKDKLDGFLGKIFNFGPVIVQNFDCDFEYLMELNPNSEEYLVSFIDEYLDDEQNDSIQKLTKAILLLRFLKIEGLFEQYFSRLKEKSVFNQLFQSNQYEILSIVYRNCQQMPNVRSTLIESMSHNLRQRGQSSMTSFMKDLVDLKHISDEFLMKSFRYDHEFVKQNDSDWKYLVNSNGSFPEHASLFINDQMKNNDVEKAEKLLDKAIQLVGYLKEENTFREYYQQHLAEHLLSNQSISSDLEDYTLSLLKKNFGNFFISKFECMLTDIVILSKSLNGDFRTHTIQNRPDLHGIGLTVNVLKTDVWPISPLNNGCTLPSTVDDAYRCFQDFYVKKHPGRRLMLLPQIGSADLKLMINQRKYLLRVSTYQMTILMLFNRRNKWTLDEILQETDINKDDVEEALIPLIINKKIGNILVKQPQNETILPDDQFLVNDQFISEHIYVKIHSLNVKLNKKLRREHIEVKLQREHENEIRAAIVRIMKSSGTMAHNQLVTQVIESLICRFTPNSESIEREIKRIIETEYISQSNDDRKTYNYVV